jgi:hypothetical protein
MSIGHEEDDDHNEFEEYYFEEPIKARAARVSSFHRRVRNKMMWSLRPQSKPNHKNVRTKLSRYFSRPVI